jgi:hypothetical protein
VSVTVEAIERSVAVGNQIDKERGEQPR